MCIEDKDFVGLPIHRCVLALYTQYFPESCEKVSEKIILIQKVVLNNTSLKISYFSNIPFPHYY